MPNMRGVGFGVALAAGHVLGDLWSPTLMGWVIDTFGQRDSMATGFGQVLAALGAVPVAQPGHDPENLTAGLLAILPALLIAGAVLLAGIRHLPREMALMLAKLRAAPPRRDKLWWRCPPRTARGTVFATVPRPGPPGHVAPPTSTPIARQRTQPTGWNVAIETIACAQLRAVTPL